MSDIKQLLGPQVLSKKGLVSVDEVIQDDVVVGFYFSAHWCPPCRGFTPALANFYNTMKTKGKKFEVIFISSDRDEESFTEYYNTMPWVALPFGERQTKQSLSEKYGVRGIPTLILLDSKGNILNPNARGQVLDDPEGDSFPWKQ